MFFKQETKASKSQDMVVIATNYHFNTVISALRVKQQSIDSPANS